MNKRRCNNTFSQKMSKWLINKCKMFNITGHQKNANQNHDATPLHTHNDDYNQSAVNKCWRYGNTGPLLYRSWEGKTCLGKQSASSSKD